MTFRREQALNNHRVDSDTKRSQSAVAMASLPDDIPEEKELAAGIAMVVSVDEYVNMLREAPGGDVMEKAKAANDFSIVLEQIIETRCEENLQSRRWPTSRRRAVRRR